MAQLPSGLCGLTSTEARSTVSANARVHAALLSRPRKIRVSASFDICMQGQNKDTLALLLLLLI